MRLKRHFIRDEAADPSADGRPVLVLDEETGKPVLSHIEVQHTGTSREQHFSDSLVAAGLMEGWMSITDGQLTLHAQPEDLVYTILRVPGKYASKTERSGYEVIHYYDCILDEAQHARLRIQKGTV
mgnify:CR=1 FL=1